MNILILGNSHSAALKSAWKSIGKNFPGVELDFFSASADVLASARLAGNRYGYLGEAADASTGWRKVHELFGAFNADLSEVDAIIFASLNIAESENIKLINRFSIDGIAEVPGRARLSKAAYFAFCDAVIEQQIRASQIAKFDRHPVFFIPQPRRAESVISSKGESDRPWATFVDGPIKGGRLLDLFYDRAEKIISAHGHALISPPLGVHGETGLVLEEFRQSRKVSESGHQDHLHMNGHYGARALVKALRAVEAWKARSATPAGDTVDPV